MTRRRSLRAQGKSPRQLGTNPRALGTNPSAQGRASRQRGTNPRAQDGRIERSLSADPTGWTRPLVLETAYAGHQFRSRLEARWAVYFDADGIEWEYEPEAYQLGDLAYLPDFWLPQVSMFAEVKPGAFDADALEKCRRLALARNSPVLLLSRRPAVRPYQAVVPRADGTSHLVDYVVSRPNDGRFLASAQAAGLVSLASIAAACSERFGT